MSALKRVARRIGMELLFPSEPDRWYDPTTGESAGPTYPPDLRTYLLTGDRPLRWIVEVGKEFNVQVHNEGDDWVAVVYAGVLKEARGQTPAAAIIALAERIEGERNVQG